MCHCWVYNLCKLFYLLFIIDDLTQYALIDDLTQYALIDDLTQYALIDDLTQYALSLIKIDCEY